MAKRKLKSAHAKPPAARYLGYEVNYFAFKHGIGRITAEWLIKAIGNDRVELDAAAVLFAQL